MFPVAGGRPCDLQPDDVWEARISENACARLEKNGTPKPWG